MICDREQYHREDMENKYMPTIVMQVQQKMKSTVKLGLCRQIDKLPEHSSGETSLLLLTHEFCSRTLDLEVGPSKQQLPSKLLLYLKY